MQNSSLNFTRKYIYATTTNQHLQITNNQQNPTVYNSYTYDAAGNMLMSNADRSYSWDAFGRLRTFQIASGGSVTKFAHYIYDAGGSRTKKLVINQQGNYESVTYIDGVMEYHRKVTFGNVEEKNYLSLQGGVELRIGGYTGDMSHSEVYTISDYLSSGGIRLDSNGAVIDCEEYYPYGESSLTTYGKKRYRFTGKEKDEESGLYYMAARYYCCSSAKFISVDPLAGKYAHQSSYCYADCNPIMKNDPSGTQSESKGTKNEGEKSKETSGATYQWSNGNQPNKNTELSSGKYSVGATDSRLVTSKKTPNNSTPTTANTSAATSNIKTQEASSWPIVIATVASSLANNPGISAPLSSIPQNLTAAAQAETAAATAESIGVNVAKETAVKVTQETTVNVVGESFFAIARTVSLTTVAVFIPTSCGTGDMPVDLSKFKFVDDDKNNSKSYLIYRTMQTINGGEWIKSPLSGADNARQLGARTSDIKPDNGIVSTKINEKGEYLGLSASSSLSKMEAKLFDNSERAEYKNKEGAVGMYDMRFLPEGLSAIEDNKITKHVSIYPNRPMLMEEYMSKLNSIKWIPVTIKNK